MTTLAGQTALVTGSSRGIGRGIALCLARAGASVWIHGRDRERVDGTCVEVEALGVSARPLLADLTDDGDVARMREEVLGVSVPDIVVANAGGNPVRPGPIEDIPLEGWRLALELNLTATFQTVAAFLPAMRRRGSGNIVAISSTASRMPNVRSPAAYASAKAGIEALVRNLAVQAGPDGIRVNAVAPGTILTERNVEQIPPEVREQLERDHPIRRLGTPRDVGDAVVFLVSDRSSWTTGTVLDVSGGRV